jgi:hypothetical protein
MPEQGAGNADGRVGAENAISQPPAAGPQAPALRRFILRLAK